MKTKQNRFTCLFDCLHACLLQRMIRIRRVSYLSVNTKETELRVSLTKTMKLI